MAKTSSSGIYESRSFLSVLGFCALLFVMMSCLIKFRIRGNRLSSKFKRKIRNANSNLDDIMESHWKEHSRLSNGQSSRLLAPHQSNIRSSVEIRTYSSYSTFLNDDKVTVLQTFESNISTKTTNKDLEDSTEPTFCNFHNNGKEHFAEEQFVKDLKTDVEKCFISKRIVVEVKQNISSESATPNSEQNNQSSTTADTNSADTDNVTSLLQESEINHYYPMTHFRRHIDQLSAEDALVHSKCRHKRKPSDEDLYIMPSTIIHSRQDHKRTL